MPGDPEGREPRSKGTSQVFFVTILHGNFPGDFQYENTSQGLNVDDLTPFRQPMPYSPDKWRASCTEVCRSQRLINAFPSAQEEASYQ